MTEQSGIFEIATLPPCAEEGPWGAIIGFVLLSLLCGTVTVLAYWQSMPPCMP